MTDSTFTAKARFDRMNGERNAALMRARDCAAVTIPSLLPPEGHTNSAPLPTPYQSLGARGVNNLASKILLAILPPGTASFRLGIDASVRQELGDQITEAEQRLAVHEQRATAKIEALNIRPVLFEVLTHLVTTGDVLFNKGREKSRMFRLDQFVIKRKPDGDPIEAIVRECVLPDQLDDETATACEIDRSKKDKLELFTVVQWNDKQVKQWQELNGKLVPDSMAYTPLKKSRWFPLRWRAVPGQDYGRSHVDEYLGDLRSLEYLSEAIVQHAAIAAQVKFGTVPGAVTKAEDVFRTPNGGTFTGRKDDVWVLQLEKQADFTVAKSVVDELSIRLSHAFLLRSGTVRDAERVTAEEVRALAQELEDALGGTYTVLASEFQLPFVRLILSEMTQTGELPPLPEKVVSPVITTGFEALGRNHSVNKLRAWLADLATVDPQYQSINKDKVAKRLGTGYGVEDLDELIKTPEQIEADNQQALTSQLVDKGTAPAINAMAKMSQ